MISAVQTLKPEKPVDDEMEMVKRTAEGDEHAFACLVSRHTTAVYRFLRRLLNHDGDAEDLTQETFLQLYKHRRKLRKNASVLPYLYTIARNKAISKIRWRQVRQILSPLTEVHENMVFNQEGSPRCNLDEANIEQRLNQALEKLNSKYRTVIILRFFEGLSFGQIAEIMNKPEGTIKTWGYRAEQELRNQLSDISEVWESIV